MKPFMILPATQGHRQCYPLLDRLDFLSRGYTYFQTKITKMTLMVNQGHQQWHNSIGYISLSVSGLK